MTDVSTPEGRRELKALPDVLDGHWTTQEGREMAERYAGKKRSELCHGDHTDFALANAVFMADRNSLDLMAYQTSAKDRIRWLSAQVAILTARAEASEQREAGLREVVNSLKETWEREAPMYRSRVQKNMIEAFVRDLTAALTTKSGEA